MRKRKLGNSGLEVALWVFAIFCQKMSGNDSREFKKRRELFIDMRNETLPIVAVRISNPDRFPIGINR
jgi:hypothetical protein